MDHSAERGSQVEEKIISRENEMLRDTIQNEWFSFLKSVQQNPTLKKRTFNNKSKAYEIKEPKKRKIWDSLESLRLEVAVNNYPSPAPNIDWVKVAAFVKTRNRSQCCAKWSLLQNKSTNGDNCKRNSSYVCWGEDEEKALALLVEKYGLRNWKAIACELENKTEQQCDQKWRSMVKNKEKILAQQSAHVEDLSYQQCPNRSNLQSPHHFSSKNPWTKQEKDSFNKLIKEHGLSNWKTIARGLGTRTNEQCRQRWQAMKRKGIRNPYQLNITTTEIDNEEAQPPKKRQRTETCKAHPLVGSTDLSQNEELVESNLRKTSDEILRFNEESQYQRDLDDQCNKIWMMIGLNTSTSTD